MYGGASLYIYQVLPLSDLGLEATKADVLKVYYSGYCTLGLTENLPSLFFTCLCDKGIVYKSTNLINKLIRINESKKLYDQNYEQEFQYLLNYIKANIEGTEDIKTKLASYREYANSKMTIFTYALMKILYLSTFNNYHKPENKELLKVNFDVLNQKIFSGESLKFSYLIALINELEISVKVINVDSMTVEDYNLGQEETFVFMRYFNAWYILYSIEDYFLIQGNPNECAEIMRIVKSKQTENTTYLKHYKATVDNLKSQNEKLANAAGKVLSLLYPNKTISSIIQSECPNLDISEALEPYICGHCNKISIHQLACGHSACDEILQSSHLSQKNPCFKCKP